jgi:hypothetical protein
MAESPAGEDVTGSGSSPGEGAGAGEGKDVKVGAPDASGGGEGGAPKTALDAVMDAVKRGSGDGKPSDGDPPSLADGQPKPGEADKGGEPDTGKKAGELGPTGQERIRELVRVNKRLEPKAQYFDQMNEFAVKNGLDHRDISFALDLIRRVKNNPASAVQLLQPLWNRVRQYTGEALPGDLAKRVEEGALTQQDAQELARARASERHRGDVDRRQAEEAEERRRQGEVERHANAIGQAVSQWERTWKSADPDYADKHPWVVAEIHRRMATEDVGALSVAEVLEIAAEAKQDVEERLKKFSPAAKDIRSPTGGSGKNRLPEPKTAVEAAERALEATRTGAM